MVWRAWDLDRTLRSSIPSWLMPTLCAAGASLTGPSVHAQSNPDGGAIPEVRVVGSGSCPTPRAVRARLRRVRTVDRATATVWTLAIRSRPGHVRLRLARAGEPPLERQISDTDCAAVAGVIVHVVERHFLELELPLADVPEPENLSSAGSAPLPTSDVDGDNAPGRGGLDSQRQEERSARRGDDSGKEDEVPEIAEESDEASEHKAPEQGSDDRSRSGPSEAEVPWTASLGFAVGGRVSGDSPVSGLGRLMAGLSWGRFQFRVVGEGLTPVEVTGVGEALRLQQFGTRAELGVVLHRSSSVRTGPVVGAGWTAVRVEPLDLPEASSSWRHFLAGSAGWFLTFRLTRWVRLEMEAAALGHPSRERYRVEPSGQVGQSARIDGRALVGLSAFWGL